MNSIQDAIYNWLTIKVVCDERPEDTAAVETEKMFKDILEEEHLVSDLMIEKDEEMYFVTYTINGELKKVKFPQELINIMINQINESPEKYRNYPR